MPWHGKADVAKHNHRAASSPHLIKMWCDVANSILKEHNDEARAIRGANSRVAAHIKKHGLKVKAGIVSRIHAMIKGE